MKKLKKYFLLGIFTFLITWAQLFAQRPQATIYYQDFEGVTQMEYTTSDYIAGLNNVYYEAYSGSPRLRFDVVAYEGNYAALFDSYDTQTYSQNYMDFTIDLSAYDVNTDSLYLQFVWNDYGDESDAGDGVWIRGSDTDAWVQAYDFDPGNHPNDTWTSVKLNLSYILSSNGQNFSSTFQIRFGQYDNYPYSTDGISFDNIGIVAPIDFGVYDILNDYTACNTPTLDVVISNYSGVDQSNFTVYLDVTNPDGTVSSFSYNYTGTLADSSLDTIQIPISLPQDGYSYEVAAYIEPDKRFIKSLFYQKVYTTLPYTENFSVENKNWILGDNFWWSTYYQDIYGTFSAGTYDSIVTPGFTITNDKYYFGYKARFGYYTGNDTVFVQIKTVCADDFITIDTIVDNSTDTGAYSNNNITTEYYVAGYDLSSYVGQKVQFRFLLHASSANNFKIYGFKIFSGYDLELSQIILDTLPYCSCPNYDLTAEFINRGLDEQTNINLSVRIYGQLDTTFVVDYPATLLPGQKAKLYLGQINASKPGYYELNATLNSIRDDNFENNIINKTIYIDSIPSLTINQQSDFNNVNGTTVHWTTAGTGNTKFYFSTDYIYSSPIPVDDSAYLASYKFGPVLPHSYLSFDYYVVGQDASGNVYYGLDTGDYVKVYISDDCNTFTDVYVINNQNTNKTSTYKSIEPIDLSKYVGKNIVFKVVLANKTLADNTDYVTMYLDNIYIGIPDVSFNNVYTSAIDQYCGNSSAEIYMDLKNNSPVTADSIKYKVDVSSSIDLDTALIGYVTNIPPYKDTTITVGVLDFSEPTRYFINGAISYPNDPDESNNSDYYYISVYSPEDQPFDEDFTPNYSWYKYNFTIASNTAYSDLLKKGDEARIFCYNQIGGINQKSVLAIRYKIETYDDNGVLVGGYLRDSDYVEVDITTDCGNSYTQVYTLDKNNQPNTTDWLDLPTIDLSQFAGQNIRVRIKAVKENSLGSFRLTLDRVQVLTNGDAGATELTVLNPAVGASVCGISDASVQVKVKNFGINDLTDVPVELDVIYGEDTVRYEQTVSLLAAGQEDSLVFNNVAFAEEGSYTLNAFTKLDDDLNPDNDQVSGGFTVQDVVSLPYTYSGSSYPPSDWILESYSSEPSSVLNKWFTLWGTYLSTPILLPGDSCSFTMPKVGQVQSDYKLVITMKYFEITDNYYIAGTEFRPGDKFIVYVSDDCGNTYVPVKQLDASNYTATSDTTIEIDLSQFTGKIISIKGEFIRNNNVGKAIIGFKEIDVRIPQPDLAVQQVYVEDGICGQESQPIYAVVANQSQYDIISDFKLKALVKDANNVLLDSLVYTYNQQLEPGQTDTIIVGTFNSVEPNTYNIQVSAEFAKDIDGNDLTANTSFTIWPAEDGFYSNDFNFNADGWKFDDNGAAWTNDRLEFANLAPDNISWFYSPIITNIPPNSYMSFDLNEVNGQFTINDTLYIYYSEDCGSTYQLLTYLTNSSNITGAMNRTFDIPLNSIAGKSVFFKFVLANHSNQLLESFDNFAIKYKDLSLLGIVTQTDKFDLAKFNPNDRVYNYAERYLTCGADNDSLIVVVQNTGNLPIYQFTVTLNATGNDTKTLTASYSGQLNPGDKTWLYLGTINTSNPGLIDLKASVSNPYDIIATNDTTGFSITTQYEYELPYDAFDGSHFNEFYYWSVDDQGKMMLQPTIAGVSYDLAALYLPQGSEAYAISPKIKLSGEHPYFYTYYRVENSLNEGHIINEESVEILVSTDCGDSWTRVWYFDVNNTDFGAEGPLAVDLSQFAGQTVRIMIKVDKGYSPGLFSAMFKDIAVYDHAPIKAIAEVDGEQYTSGQDIELCQGDLLQLSNEYGVTGDFSYKWLYDNGSSVVQLDDDPYYSLNVTPENSGTYYLIAWSPSSNQQFIDSLNITVNPLPTKPVISGPNQVVSNVLTTQYKADIDYADQYIWTLSAGGYITGDSVATVYWNDGFVGTVVIKAQGYNQCGYGPVSDDYIVYVEYLNPGSGNNSSASSSKDDEANIKVDVYPNPTTDNVTLKFDDDKWIGASYKVVNQMGNEVAHGWFSSDKHKINLEDAAPGLYLIKIMTVDGQRTTKIVVKQ